ncbi:invasion associated locus B family protein [Roseomonas elaeocarpi]|uniref:Invasion associated locus B family protein n=1 Tax=Roseomonas elaeocarpi TaxID=907779 RepID=A0ABV6JZ50_9PROT
MRALLARPGRKGWVALAAVALLGAAVPPLAGSAGTLPLPPPPAPGMPAAAGMAPGTAAGTAAAASPAALQLAAANPAVVGPAPGASSQAASSPGTAAKTAASAGATAQAAAAQAAAQRTATPFGDWSLICTARPAGGRGCEAAAAVVTKEGKPLVLAALGRSEPKAPLRLVLQVPVNARVDQPLRLLPAQGEASLLPFRSCNALGCFAEITLEQGGLPAGLRAQTAEQPLRVEWQDAAGNRVALPLSWRGFNAAAEALERSGT